MSSGPHGIEGNFGTSIFFTLSGSVEGIKDRDSPARSDGVTASG
jgi:hypothetical protein